MEYPLNISLEGNPHGFSERENTPSLERNIHFLTAFLRGINIHFFFPSRRENIYFFSPLRGRMEEGVKQNSFFRLFTLIKEDGNEEEDRPNRCRACWGRTFP